MTTTPSLAKRVRRGLDALLHRSHDPDRERQWAKRETELRREHDEAADAPVAGLRGMQPYDYGIRKRH
jgi:hypothetical protein